MTSAAEPAQVIPLQHPRPDRLPDMVPPVLVVPSPLRKSENGDSDLIDLSPVVSSSSEDLQVLSQRQYEKKGTPPPKSPAKCPNPAVPAAPSVHTATTSATASTSTSAPAAPQQWKKLLWLKQAYPDNYTDSSFLSQLKRNSTVVSYSFWKLFKDFSLIVLHLSVILCVILVFYSIYQLDWNPEKPALISSVFTVIGFIIYVVTLKIRRNRELINLQRWKIEQLAAKARTTRGHGRRGLVSASGSASPSRSSSPSANYYERQRSVSPRKQLLRKNHHNKTMDLEKYLTEPTPPDLFTTFKSSILMILHMLTFSPVLKSLANSSASDSIWVISAWLCFLNMLFNDYIIDFPQKRKLPSSLEEAGSATGPSLQLSSETSHSNMSKNIALSNAIVLASRLNSNLSAFCFILFAVEVCGLFPTFNNFTRRCGFWQFHWAQFWGIVLGVDYTVYKFFGLGWLAAWLALHLLISVACPLYFIALQKYKDELQGPWDPAHPVVKSMQ